MCLDLNFIFEWKTPHVFCGFCGLVEFYILFVESLNRQNVDKNYNFAVNFKMGF